MNKRIFEFALFYIVLTLIAFLINYYSDFNITRLSSKLSIHKTLFYSISTALIIVLFTFVLVKITPIFNHLEKEISTMILPVSIQNTFFISVLSAIGEELIFRGILFQKFGFIFSSLCFGLIHFIPKKEFYPWTIFAVCLGFILGGLFHITGTVLAPIICHFLINFINILIIRHKYPITG